MEFAETVFLDFWVFWLCGVFFCCLLGFLFCGVFFVFCWFFFGLCFFVCFLHFMLFPGELATCIAFTVTAIQMTCKSVFPPMLLLLPSNTLS